MRGAHHTGAPAAGLSAVSGASAAQPPRLSPSPSVPGVPLRGFARGPLQAQTQASSGGRAPCPERRSPTWAGGEGREPSRAGGGRLPRASPSRRSEPGDRGGTAGAAQPGRPAPGDLGEPPRMSGALPGGGGSFCCSWPARNRSSGPSRGAGLRRRVLLPARGTPEAGGRPRARLRTSSAAMLATLWPVPPSRTDRRFGGLSLSAGRVCILGRLTPRGGHGGGGAPVSHLARGRSPEIGAHRGARCPAPFAPQESRPRRGGPPFPPPKSGPGGPGQEPVLGARARATSSPTQPRGPGTPPSG